MSVLDRPEPLDFNGSPLRVGDKVKHSLADRQRLDKKGRPIAGAGDMSTAFIGVRTAVQICNPMCVEVQPCGRNEIPVYMSDFLEPAP